MFSERVHRSQNSVVGRRAAQANSLSEAEKPVEPGTVAWGFLMLVAACVAVRDEVILRDVTFEQGVLAVSLAAACAWRAREDTPWAVPTLRACAAIGIFGFFLERVLGLPIVDVKDVQGFGPLLATLSTVGLATQTFVNRDENGQWTFAERVPLPPPPISSKIPYWQFAVIVFAVISQNNDWRGALGLNIAQSQDIANAMGLTVGSLGGWALTYASLCAVITPCALVAWSRWYVKGEHGPVQKLLAPVLLPSPTVILPLAGLNALAEEVEFRMMLQGSLLAGPAAGSYPWVAVAVTLQAAYFAILHYRVGLPSGRLGFVMVFFWALCLGWLRWWAGGVGLVLMLHVSADVIIFILVLIEEGKRASQASLDAAERQKIRNPFQSFLGK